MKNLYVQMHIRYERLPQKTFELYVLKQTWRVDSNIVRLEPSRLALITDGQTTSDAHYMAVFATFPATSQTWISVSGVGRLGF